jgi:Icc-related predicted phosphoesterase
MNIIITEEQFDNIKDPSNLKIVNFSDLHKSGTWSPDIMTKMEEGDEPYVYFEGKFIRKSESPKKKSNKVVMLNPKTAERFNELKQQSDDLLEESKKLKRKSDMILDFISQRVGMEIK